MAKIILRDPFDELVPVCARALARHWLGRGPAEHALLEVRVPRRPETPPPSKRIKVKTA